MYPVPVSAVFRDALANGAADKVLASVGVGLCGLVSDGSNAMTTQWLTCELSHSSRVVRAQFWHRPKVAVSALSGVVKFARGEVVLASASKPTKCVVVILRVLVRSVESGWSSG